MKENARNIAVGLTVLGALAMIFGMITLFTVLPSAFRRGYPLTAEAATTHNIRTGDRIYLAGIEVGQVTDVGLTDPADHRKGVRIHARIDGQVRLPGNAVIQVSAKGFSGQAHVEIAAGDKPRLDPKTGAPLKVLPTDGSVVLSVIDRGNGLIPDAAKDALGSLNEALGAFKEIGVLAKNLNEAILPTPATATRPAGGDGLKAAVGRLNRTLDGLEAIVGDTENQANLKASLANLSRTTAQAGKAVEALQAFAAEARKTTAGASQTVQSVTKTSELAAKRLDQVAAKVLDSTDKLSDLLTTLNKAAGKMESGEGTAGRLLNDPKLYNNLLEVGEQMTKLLREVRQLVATWKKSGMGIKLK